MQLSVKFICGFVFSERLEHSAIHLLLQQMSEVREELRVMKMTLFEVLRKQKGIEAVRNGRLSAGVTLPVKTKNEVTALEEKLLSPQFYTEMASKFNFVNLKANHINIIQFLFYFLLFRVNFTRHSSSLLVL